MYMCVYVYLYSVYVHLDELFVRKANFETKIDHSMEDRSREARDGSEFQEPAEW